MALDGIFLRHLKKEINSNALNCKVDKIYQPSKDELIITLRDKGKVFKMLLSCRASSARVHFTNCSIQNPKSAPMLCMLFRKKLNGAKFIGAEQPSLERILFLNFESVTILGDTKRLSIIVEIMGKHSNIILIDEQQKIIDALKRVTPSMSSVRLVLPGATYKFPPSQDKISLLNCDTESIVQRLKTQIPNSSLSKNLMDSILGISPVVARELAFNNTTDVNDFVQANAFRQAIKELINTARLINGRPYILKNNQNKAIDFSFMFISQYGNLAISEEKSSFSELLDEFYSITDARERAKIISNNLYKTLQNVIKRTAKKINLQKHELANSKKRTDFKIYADLLNANLYQIPNNTSYVVLKNFYDNMSEVRINLDPQLTASQNAQMYYKHYKKAKSTEENLNRQIEKSVTELTYLESTLDFLRRATTEEEIEEIRYELIKEGFLKRVKNRKINKQQFKPYEYTTSNGFKVLVGRNNTQNDKLTLKLGKNNDLWFHTKDIPGAHTLMRTEGRLPDEQSIKEAAKLAAKHSKAELSSNVPVDYTLVKYVTKPSGAKPGMVIYKNQKTVFVTPN